MGIQPQYHTSVIGVNPETGSAGFEAAPDVWISERRTHNAAGAGSRAGTFSAHSTALLYWGAIRSAIPKLESCLD